ncbi:MAG: hypothetical protein QCI00_09275, partial [Candidatus Thermoplasmatota archaeon]|nr:hypothetical protein [Candidatus Thermoplasmatota archaeon]
MSGRYRDATGINYPFTFEVSKLSKSLKWNLNIENDIKDGFNIIILSHQPGIGKTTNVLKYMKNHPHTFYFTDRHRAIEEHTKEWEKKGVEYAHWKGFTQICNTEPINKLYNQYHLPPKAIIENQDWSNKSKDIAIYNSQFNNGIRVFAPFNYLQSPYLKDHNPEIVFIDERITQLDDFNLKADKLKAFLKITDAPEEIIKNAEKRNLWFFLKENRTTQIESVYSDTVIKNLKENNHAILKSLKEFKPYEFIRYINWGRIYKYNSDSYSIPYYYYAFNILSKGIPLVILDASFNINLFHYFLETYNGESQKLGKKGFTQKPVKVKIYYSDITNKDSIIYRMRPKGAWSKTSISDAWENKTRPWISRDMRNIMDIFGTSNVGIISFKEYGEICQTLGFDMEYYGGLRGTNLLEDKLVLVILGSWFPPPPSWEVDEKQQNKDKDYLDDLVRKYFQIIITEKDVYETRIGAPEEVETSHDILKKGIARFTTDKQLKDNETPADFTQNHPVSMINTMFNDEIYQAFHRNRALRYPRIIFSY